MCNTSVLWLLLMPAWSMDPLVALRWRHNGLDSVSNHQPHDCLLNRSFGRRSKYTSKLRVTGLCVGNSPVTGEFPARMASNAENVSIWWRHHGNCSDVTLSRAFLHTCVMFYAYLSRYPGYFREPHWKSVGLPGVSRVTWWVYTHVSGARCFDTVSLGTYLIWISIECWWFAYELCFNIIQLVLIVREITRSSSTFFCY